MKKKLEKLLRLNTEFLKLKAKLGESEERYRILVELSPEPIIVHSGSSILYINPAGAKMLGAPDQEAIIGMPVLDLPHPDYKQIAKDRIEQLKAGKPTDLIEEKFVRLDGTVIDVEVRAVPIRYAGKPAIQLICRDITQRKRADLALQQSEQRLRTLINAMPDFVNFKDGEGRWMEANEFALDLFQLQGVPYIGKKDSELAEYTNIRRETLLNCEVSDEQAWTAGAVTRVEENAVADNGSITTLDLIKVPIFYPDGSRQGLVVIGRDITERKRAEAGLRKSEERYRSVVNSIKEVVFQTNELGEWTFLNQAWYAITGFSVQESLGTSYIDYVHPEDQPLNDILFQELVEGKKDACHHEIRYVTKQNGFRWMEVYARLIKDSNGHITGTSGTLNDITQRKFTEQRLEEERQRYISLFEHNPAAVFSIDLDGRFVTVNPAAERVTGYQPEELIHNTARSLIFKEDARRLARHFKRAVQGEPQHFEIPIIHKTGNTVELRVTYVPIVVFGKVAGVYVIGQDITESKKTEELLRKSDKLAVVGQLAAGVAHEIRNPLTTLKGFLQLLQSRNAQDQEYYTIMLSELDRINTIVSEFLFLAKPQVVYFQPINLNLLLHNVIVLLQPQAMLNNVQFDIQFELDIAMINGEENQLKQVFINILKNAIEAMPCGGTIVVAMRMQDASNILIRFIDQGCGIPEDRIPNLGEPFYTTKEKGTGLGLMVSYKIIEAHNGSIQVYSRINQGTTVDVTLPVLLDRDTPEYTYGTSPLQLI